jgi:hypothetical protein
VSEIGQGYDEGKSNLFGDTHMTRITLDASLAAQLQQLGQSAELCDPNGQVVGRFVPLIDLAQWEPVSADVSSEELARRAKSTSKRYSTVEVLAHLEKL